MNRPPSDADRAPARDADAADPADVAGAASSATPALESSDLAARSGEGDPAAGLASLVTALVSGNADDWDRAGRLPIEVIRGLGAAGALCAQVPSRWGGPGLSAAADGALTAHTGALCASVRSLMTSQGMAAWTLSRWGSAQQRADHLPALVGGALAAVAFSEAQAGSDLSAMTTRIHRVGDTVRVAGEKVWVTGAAYADLVVVFGAYADGAAMVVVPTGTAGVVIRERADPVGCRAAGHADVLLDGVTLDAGGLLPGAGAPLGLLVQSVLAAGRLSVAWGCLGMIRCCLREAVRHATAREQFGVRLIRHQLVARHIGEMHAAEQAVLRLCEHASRCWDARSPEMVTSALVAKHIAATEAARAAGAAAQVLASAGARDGHPVARAHRDAKLMEIIEGSNEICQLQLAEQAVGVYS